MTLYSVRSTQTGLYLIEGQWGEEPEWFNARELQSLKLPEGTDRRAVAIEPQDFSADDCGLN
jgi:hypothetical protein